GWDQGNLATLIQDHYLLGDFPHEGFCDLQFYHMVQYAKPMRTKAILPVFSNYKSYAVIRNFTHMKSSVASVNVQDPNAIRAQQISKERKFFTDDQVYLLHLRNDDSNLVFISMNTIRDVAGKYLLQEVISQISQDKQMSWVTE
ncbi:MAG: hypothetical protein ACP5E3_18100, partial [Bacteroidales bacterium]